MVPTFRLHQYDQYQYEYRYLSQYLLVIVCLAILPPTINAFQYQFVPSHSLVHHPQRLRLTPVVPTSSTKHTDTFFRRQRFPPKVKKGYPNYGALELLRHENDEGSISDPLLLQQSINDNSSLNEIGKDNPLVDANAAASDDDDDDYDDERNQNTSESIFKIAVPALAGLAIDPLMTLADTVFVGKTAQNADALAGMGSAAALLTFCFYLFNFLTTVTTPLVSQRRAAGQEKLAVEVGGQALSLAILLGAVLCTVLVTFSQPLLDVMGTGATGIYANAYALSFLKSRAIAAPAVFLISASTGILRGYLDTTTTFLILLGANIVNFLLDVILIAWLHMGPQGAAIATTTAEWICAISLLLILAGKLPSADGTLGSNQQLRKAAGGESSSMISSPQPSVDEESEKYPKLIVLAPTLKPPTWKAMQPLVVASSSVFVRSFMIQISIAGAAAMAARSGGGVSAEASVGTAAHQIALQLWLLCSFVCDALAAASQTLVADRLGRDDRAGVRSVIKTIFVYSLGLGLVLAVALGIGDATGFLLDLFTDDIPTQEMLKPLLTILILAQPLNSFVFAADGVLQGAAFFQYEAKGMIFSSLFGISSFFGFQYFGGGGTQSSSTLLHVWYALVILQLCRGLTSLWKLAEPGSSINIFSRD